MMDAMVTANGSSFLAVLFMFIISCASILVLPFCKKKADGLAMYDTQCLNVQLKAKATSI